MVAEPVKCHIDCGNYFSHFILLKSIVSFQAGC
jgi:hypothetical protein